MTQVIKRRKFLKNTVLTGIGVAILNPVNLLAGQSNYKTVDFEINQLPTDFQKQFKQFAKQFSKQLTEVSNFNGNFKRKTLTFSDFKVERQLGKIKQVKFKNNFGNQFAIILKNKKAQVHCL